MTEDLSGRYWREIGKVCPLDCEVRIQNDDNGHGKKGFVAGKLRVKEIANGMAYLFRHPAFPGKNLFVSRPNLLLNTPNKMDVQIRRSND